MGVARRLSSAAPLTVCRTYGWGSCLLRDSRMRTQRMLCLALALAMLVALGSLERGSAGAGVSEEGDPDW